MTATADVARSKVEAGSGEARAPIRVNRAIAKYLPEQHLVFRWFGGPGRETVTCEPRPAVAR